MVVVSLRPATLLARATNLTPSTQRLQRRLGRRHARVLRASGGRRLNHWFGAPVLVLETVGRRTGRPRATPVVYLRDDAGLVVVAANGGADRVPAWWHNLESAGRGSVVVDGSRQSVVARVATGRERDRLWRAFAALYPPVDDYLALTDRNLPVVVLEPDPGSDRQRRYARGMDDEHPSPEELAAAQAEREAAEQARARAADLDEEEHTAERRADKAHYLREKLEEQRQADER